MMWKHDSFVNEQKLKTQNMKRENTHQPFAIIELAWKHTKFTITNFCVLEFQINNSDLRRHNLGLYPKYKIF